MAGQGKMYGVALRRREAGIWRIDGEGAHKGLNCSDQWVVVSGWRGGGRASNRLSPGNRFCWLQQNWTAHLKSRDFRRFAAPDMIDAYCHICPLSLGDSGAFAM